MDRVSAANTRVIQDVYVVPAEGGEPKRLTWHPGADIVQGWTPDGNRVCSHRRGQRAARAVRRGSGRFRSRAASKSRCLAARLSGQDLGGRITYRLSHEQLVGRRTPQLSRRPEPPIWIVDLEIMRPGLAAVDRFERYRSGMARRHGLLHFRSRRC